MRVETDQFRKAQRKSQKKRTEFSIQAINEATIMGKLVHPFIVRYR